MVNEVVVRRQLTDEMLVAGETLLAALDAAKVPLQGAFWLYMLEPETWRLVLVSNQVNKYGPLKVYGVVHDVLLSVVQGKRLSLSDITVMDKDDRLAASLRKESKKRLIVPGTRLTSTTINSHYIEDAYIYRLT